MMIILMMMFFSIFSIYLVNNKILNKMLLLLINKIFIFFFLKVSLFKFNFNLIYFNNFGVDKISYSLIFLMIWMFFLMLMSMEKLMNKLIYNLVVFMMMFLYLTFFSLNLMFFFIFFESSMILMMLMIVGWGYQIERIQASFYMILYTLVSSLPMLMVLLNLYNYNFYSLSFFLILNKMIYMNLINFILLIFIFLVKFPMFLFHIWLPKAHVEAPVFGSMILASILLKLAGYGLMRLLMMMMNFVNKMNYLIFSVCLIGMVYLSMLCLRQFDMKILVAYSSIVHMCMVILGIMVMNYSGFMGGMYLMLGHGLTSSSLFVLVNFCYERLGSRSMLIVKGLMSLFPSMSMWWFLMIVSNFSSPPSINLVGEIFVLIGILSKNLLFFLVMFPMFLGVFYSLYLYTFSNHGKLNNKISKNNNIKEFLLMNFHWIPMNYLILNLYLY
uniref:NADH-ubiquinone oxidoreductase chain 4 n=1 Tax=Helorus sp. ZJUH_2016017 TaxID=2491159 RepID=A0A3Q8U9U6_9HYME|nr:NADH dehydrogenase subunit 4 [Helorus sp. ZJUH_2016017]